MKGFYEHENRQEAKCQPITLKNLLIIGNTQNVVYIHPINVCFFDLMARPPGVNWGQQWLVRNNNE